MDVIERLTLEAAAADTMIASEHRQRYEFAATTCGGQRVLDLCCGSGYGTAILAGVAREVVGVDNDAATVESARATLSSQLDNVRFELADAVGFLATDIPDRFDTVVCFEGLEHLPDLDGTLAHLRGHAARGVKIIASVPNSKLFSEENPYHLTQFGHDEAVAAFAGFPNLTILPQFLAEGSLICPPGATETEVSVALEDRDEIPYANHFIFCVNLDPAEMQRAHRGHLQVNAAPLFNRWAEGLKQAVSALRRENARLARAHLGQGGSAAAAALATREAQLLTPAELQAPAFDDAPPSPAEDPGGWAEIRNVTAPVFGPGEDPNSWEQRHRRAAEHLVPWIEQTVPLAGKTVLEYGCGNAAVSCAVAARARRLIGLDIDRHGIEHGQAEVRRRGLRNVELELHPVETILDAVAAHRGEVDVFLLYAVLEHLTVSERLAVLRLARDVVRTDGVIVICETPNRLVFTDHHTAQIPFFHLLPDELALEYHERSPREDFKAAVAAAAATGGRPGALEAIVRWGRGVSYHELELVFDDGLDRHVIASNYDLTLFGERPVGADEVVLARYLERWRPDLAPVFSRAWLDLILSPRAVDKRPPFLWPWTAETVESADVGWTRGENLRLSGPEAVLWVTLPQPTTQLTVIAVPAAPGLLALSASPEGGSAPLTASIAAPGGATCAATFGLNEPARRIALAANAECHVVFVGYEA